MWDGVQYFTLMYKTAISLSLLPSSLISPSRSPLVITEIKSEGRTEEDPFVL